MLTIKTSPHIRISKHIKGYRSGRHGTGVSVSHLDLARVRLEEKRLALREARRVWLAEQWRKSPRRDS
jgi:hypothetical protein